MKKLLQHWKIIQVEETILLIDGDDESRIAVKHILEINGFRVVEACHGIEALQILGTFGEAIQLALCSEDLPDMTAGQWRGQMRFMGPEIPSIILSDKEKSEIVNLPLGTLQGSTTLKSLLITKILEKIRRELDEEFFKARRLASVA